jgi:hypothetical protein
MFSLMHHQQQRDKAAEAEYRTRLPFIHASAERHIERAEREGASDNDNNREIVWAEVVRAVDEISQSNQLDRRIGVLRRARPLMEQYDLTADDCRIGPHLHAEWRTVCAEVL